MLKSVSFENYKSYKNKSGIEIKPLTILCGVNSSGKSSILKSILMMKQSAENNRTSDQITYNGKYVNNGKYETLANAIGQPISICLNFEVIPKSKSDKIPYKNLYNLLYGISLNNKDFECTFLYPIDISISFMFRNNFIESYNINISHKNHQKECSIDIVIRRKQNKVYDILFKGFPQNNTFISGEIKDCNCYFNGMSITSIFTSTPPREFDFMPIFSFIYGLFSVITWQFSNNVISIAPLRESPSRYYSSESSYSSVGVNGENAAQVLNGNKDRSLGFILPPKLDKFSFEKETKYVSEHTNQWLNYLDVGSYDIPFHENDMFQLLINNHNINDVGFGTSQILPVVIQSIIMKQHQTLILEQPEIHLHPKAQMKMADFLLATAKSGKNVIVETHSDHIINRITRRVMENQNIKDMVKIYFVSKDETNCSQINSDIEINPIKGLIKCPPEFFDQYGNELRVIMKQGYENLKNGK